MNFENSLPFVRSACFYVRITGNFERSQYFNFETNVLKNENLFQKTGVQFSLSWSECNIILLIMHSLLYIHYLYLYCIHLILDAVYNLWNMHSEAAAVLKIFANVTGKYLCWSLFFTKLQAFRPSTLIKRDSYTGVFLWNLRNS